MDELMSIKIRLNPGFWLTPWLSLDEKVINEQIDSEANSKCQT